MHREGSIDLIDAAVIVRGADGKVRFEETADPSGKKWAKRGAIAGGVVGLIFPPSMIASRGRRRRRRRDLGQGPRQGLQGRGPEGGRREHQARHVRDHRDRRGPGGRAAGDGPRGLREDRPARPQRRGGSGDHRRRLRTAGSARSEARLAGRKFHLGYFTKFGPPAWQATGSRTDGSDWSTRAEGADPVHGLLDQMEAGGVSRR